MTRPLVEANKALTHNKTFSIKLLLYFPLRNNIQIQFNKYQTFYKLQYQRVNQSLQRGQLKFVAIINILTF